jgi:hypothetical protein
LLNIPQTKDRTGSSEPAAKIPSEAGDEEAPASDLKAEPGELQEDVKKGDKNNTNVEGHDRIPGGSSEQSGTDNASREDDNRGRRPARPDEPFEKWERDEMEKLLQQVCGHLGMQPFVLLWLQTHSCQLSSQPASLKARILQITFSSMLIGAPLIPGIYLWN